MFYVLLNPLIKTLINEKGRLKFLKRLLGCTLRLRQKSKIIFWFCIKRKLYNKNDYFYTFDLMISLEMSAAYYIWCEDMWKGIPTPGALRSICCVREREKTLLRNTVLTPPVSGCLSPDVFLSDCSLLIPAFVFTPSHITSLSLSPVSLKHSFY